MASSSVPFAGLRTRSPAAHRVGALALMAVIRSRILAPVERVTMNRSTASEFSETNIVIERGERGGGGEGGPRGICREGRGEGGSRGICREGGGGGPCRRTMSGWVLELDIGGCNAGTIQITLISLLMMGQTALWIVIRSLLNDGTSVEMKIGFVFGIWNISRAACSMSSNLSDPRTSTDICS